MNSWLKHVLSGALLCASPNMHLTLPLHFPTFCICPPETRPIHYCSCLTSDHVRSTLLTCITAVPGNDKLMSVVLQRYVVCHMSQ